MNAELTIIFFKSINCSFYLKNYNDLKKSILNLIDFLISSFNLWKIMKLELQLNIVLFNCN